MAKGMYIGDSSNIARKVKKIYIGDSSNKARKVKKVYIGDASNKARLCWTSEIDVLVTGSSKNFYSTDDFTTWKTSAHQLNSTLLKGNFGNGRFVFLTRNSSQAYHVAISTDGVNWTHSNIKDNFENLSFIDGKFIYFETTTPYLNYSTDGISWTRVAVTGYHSSAPNIFCTTRGKGINVHVSTFNMIYSSTDNYTFTQRTAITTATNSNISYVTYGNGRFVGVGSYSYVWYSDDGITWTKKQSATYSSDYNYDKVVYGNGIYVATMKTQARIFYSKDGVSWTMVNNYHTLQDIVFKDRFYAIANNDYIAYSDDGINWIKMNGTGDTSTRVSLIYSTDGGGKYEYNN